ncbi:hypothetical protein JCGZ_04395 [Jatropha curcas]|uniref:Uncharacterized protein n=1 Tax=Jatropha curcas TaxID=180498 RepID=A0A067L1V7_JATCU|nr:DNA-3-methyladenine glycosylase 1 [Jatropha curcas]KDP38470.1 hypothetical protein JCGZ_04395 [Jatropha curcas]
MSVANKLQSSAKPVPEPRAILGPTGNRVRVLEESRRKSEVLKKAQLRPRKPAAKAAVSEMPQEVVKNNLSVDSLSSSDSNSSSSSSGSSAKVASPRRTVKRNGLRAVKVVPDGVEFGGISPKQDLPVKKCDWITPHSDPLYMSFHDEEWGVPVHDDRKLFELLVFSQALAEMSWPAILHMRDIFRKLFDNFDPSSVAQFTEKKLLSLKVNNNLLLSEPKLRAIVENAKLLIKVQHEFGSFNNYCWRFVNHTPLRNGFRYARQVPVKTPKAELISKDLMQRGFRCVGPTVVYSFMQVAGIVNDHLVTCFRYQECNANVKKNCSPKIEETEVVVTKALETTHLSQ